MRSVTGSEYTFLSVNDYPTAAVLLPSRWPRSWSWSWSISARSGRRTRYECRNQTPAPGPAVADSKPSAWQKFTAVWSPARLKIYAFFAFIYLLFRVAYTFVFSFNNALL